MRWVVRRTEVDNRVESREVGGMSLRASLLRLPALVALFLSLAGCDSDPEPDGGARDAAMLDAGASDGGPSDGGPSDGGPSDAGADAGGRDAGPIDAGADGGEVDSGIVVDAGPVPDAGTDGGPSDAGADAGSECHALAYGAPAVPLTRVSEPLPAPTGGTVPPGTYDLTRALAPATAPLPFQRFRGTWVVEAGSVLHTREALSSSTVLPDTPVRSWTFDVSGTEFRRTASCAVPDPATRAHGYSVVPVGAAGVELWIYTGSLVQVYTAR